LAAWLLAWLLALTLACDSGGGGGAQGGCLIAGQLEKEGLVIVPLSAFTKKRMNGGAWSPLKLLARPCQASPVPPRVEIDDRTEFYAFYSPPGEAQSGRQVVFSWYYGKPPRLYTKPALKVLIKREGFPRPVAVSYIWSKPHGASKVLSLGGLHSVRSRAQWEASRIFGPRTLVISQFAGFDQGRPKAGKTLARAVFEIHEKGVQLY
jgi:hypothetical protein